MTKLFHTRTFKSGNSVAVRLPRGFSIPAGAEVEVEKSGDLVTVRVARHPTEVRRRMQKLLDDLESIGPVGEVEERRPIEFPDRPGLY